MEEEHLHDPFRFHYESSTRTFSLRTKVIAIFMVLIFISIPLYEINEHTFQINGTYFEYIHSCFGFGRYWQPF